MPLFEDTYSSSTSPWLVNPMPFSTQQALNTSSSVSSFEYPDDESSPCGLRSSYLARAPGIKKGSKRRSRAFARPPITILSADPSNFRDMVQQLTGIPLPPSLQQQRRTSLPPWSCSAPPAHLHGPPQNKLPTLDTSSAFLDLLHDASSSSRVPPNDNLSFDGFSSVPLLQPHPHGSFNTSPFSELSFSRPSALPSAPNVEYLRSLLLDYLNPSKQDTPNDQNNSAPAFWAPIEGTVRSDRRDRETHFAGALPESLASDPVEKMESFNRRQAAELESFLMSEADCASRTLHSADSRLPCDGVHAAAAASMMMMGLARSA